MSTTCVAFALVFYRLHHWGAARPDTLSDPAKLRRAASKVSNFELTIAVNCAV
jgi:hypothetical protein